MKLFRFNNKRKNTKIAAILAASLILSSLSGCGKKAAEPIPELMSPLAAAEAYRPVEIGSVGDIYILNGIVVPKEYPVFSEKMFQIADINVRMGDYVNEGDVIATGNTLAVDRQITSLNNTLSLLRAERSSTETISKKNEEIMEYKKKACEEVGYEEEAAEYAKQILIERENRRYRLASYDNQIRSTNNSILEAGDEKAKLVFTAPHSGYVTFIKDFSATNTADASENIAIIADYDDLAIEVPDLPYNKYNYRNCEEKYTIQNGEKIPLTEYEYDPKELGYADTMIMYPPIKFNLGGVKAPIGSTIPLYFQKRSVTNVMIVGKDSVFLDNDENYVYVKTETGRERRKVEIGATDNLHYEIKSGVEVGELVFYENGAAMPANYTEHVITHGDYQEVFETETVKRAYTDPDIYLSGCKGMIRNLAFVGASDVGAGQELIRIETDSQAGDIANLKNQIADNTKMYNDTVKELNERQQGDEEAIKGIPDMELPPEPDMVFLVEMLKENGFTDAEIEEFMIKYEFTEAEEPEQPEQNPTEPEKIVPEQPVNQEPNKQEPIKTDPVTPEQPNTPEPENDGQNNEQPNLSEQNNDPVIPQGEGEQNTEDQGAEDQAPELQVMFDEENPTGGEQLQPEGEKKEENKEENKEEKKEEGSKVEPGEQGETEEEVNPIKEARFEKALAEYEAAQKAYTDALRDSKYVKEICEADLDIISVSRTIEKKRYDTENAELNESLKELTEAGAGVDVSYTATHSGKSGKTNLATNTSVENGQYLFTVMCEGKKLLRVSLMQQSDPSKPENEAAKIGQTVEILIGGQTYYGKCVGKNGSPTSLNLFTRNGSPQITNSKAYTDASDMMFFVEMEDDSVYDMIPESPEDKSVTPIAQFRGKEIHGAIVVPVKGLYSERDQANEAAGKGNKYFVWKITDEGLVKQYVELYETKVITENKMVLSGLSEGDKIAIEGN